MDRDDAPRASPLATEAATLGRHLAGRAIDDDSVRRYADAIRAGFAPLDAREDRLLQRMVRHPSLLGFVDAGQALLEPGGGVRRRLLLMFAILETSPRHCDLFLPRQVSWAQGVAVAWVGGRSIARGALGLVLYWLLR